MIRRVSWVICLIWMMIKTDSVRKERVTDCLTKRCDVIHICLFCRTVFFYGKMCHMSFLRSRLSLRHKIKSACRLYFFDRKAKEAGAWGCQIPNKFLPVYIQGGTCSTLCDVSGAHADLGRLRISEKKISLGNDAQAVA